MPKQKKRTRTMKKILAYPYESFTCIESIFGPFQYGKKNFLFNAKSINPKQQATVEEWDNNCEKGIICGNMLKML